MSDLSDQELKLFIDLVHKCTGIQMNPMKRALLMNRLNRRLNGLQLKSYREYYEYLTQNPFDQQEKQYFIDAVTTNETYFFRAPKIWEYFSKSFLPAWARLKRPLQIWCAAASSGEEPYTVAILCAEFAELQRGFTWTMKASDISQDMLTHCREATYSGRSIEKLEKRLLEKYFDDLGNGRFGVASSLKKYITFFHHNLLDPPKYKEFDLILLRNVMIYFNPVVKESVLTHMSAALKPGGTLIIGESEALMGLKSGFKYVMPSIYQRDG